LEVKSKKTKKLNSKPISLYNKFNVISKQIVLKSNEAKTQENKITFDKKNSKGEAQNKKLKTNDSNRDLFSGIKRTNGIYKTEIHLTKKSKENSHITNVNASNSTNNKSILSTKQSLTTKHKDSKCNFDFNLEYLKKYYTKEKKNIKLEI